MSWFSIDMISENRFYAKHRSDFAGQLSEVKLGELIAYNHTAPGSGCSHVSMPGSKRTMTVYVDGNASPRQVCGIPHHRLSEGSRFLFTRELNDDDTEKYAVRVGRWPFAETLLIDLEFKPDEHTVGSKEEAHD